MLASLSRLARFFRIVYVRWFKRQPYDSFGHTDPRLMPTHLFWNCLHLDYASAARADITGQNYSVCPRHWYINATFRCAKCRDNFWFTVEEQRFWYEELQFFIESVPRHCSSCRKNLRLLKSLRKEYDARIASALSSGDLAEKRALVEIIDGISEVSAGLPMQIGENRKTLAGQISRTVDPSDA